MYVVLLLRMSIFPSQLVCTLYLENIERYLRLSPGVLGIQGENGYLFSGIWEQGHLFSGIWGESITFWGLGIGEQGAEEKHFRELGRKVIFLPGGREQTPPWGGGVIFQ